MLVSLPICALGDETSRLRSTLVLTVCVAVAVWLVFIVGLGLPIIAFRGVL